MPCLGNTLFRHSYQPRHAVSVQVRPTISLPQPQKRTTKITLGRKVPLAGRTLLLPELPVGEFGDDVEVSEVASVFLDQMEQDAFERVP